jgi:chromosome segregation ATPase
LSCAVKIANQFLEIWTENEANLNTLFKQLNEQALSLKNEIKLFLASCNQFSSFRNEMEAFQQNYNDKLNEFNLAQQQLKKNLTLCQTLDELNNNKNKIKDLKIALDMYMIECTGLLETNKKELTRLENAYQFQCLFQQSFNDEINRISSELEKCTLKKFEKCNNINNLATSPLIELSYSAYVNARSRFKKMYSKLKYVKW